MIPKQEKSGIPLVGFGASKLKGKEGIETLLKALETGYRHIDTADNYGNHSLIGSVIKDFHRDELFITTKLQMDDLTPPKIRSATTRFLNELQVNYLDLLLIHWPNEHIPLHETLEEMVKLQNEGLTFKIGVSNFVRKHFQEIEPYHFPIMTNQIEVHPYFQRKVLINFCNAHKIPLTAYRPLAKGGMKHEPLLNDIGKKYGKSGAQVALKWLIQQNIAVIPRSTNPLHLKENLNVFDFQLSDEEVLHIESLDKGVSIGVPPGRPTFID